MSKMVDQCKFLKSVARWLLLLLLFTQNAARITVSGKDPNIVRFILPRSFRAEGRITLVYKQSDNQVEHQLAFEEVTSFVSSRSRVKIGHVSYEPTVYYNREGRVLKLNEQGRCEPFDGGQGNHLKMIPELDWFARMSYTDEELAKAVGENRFEMGPSLLLRIPLINATIQVSVNFFQKNKGQLKKPIV